MTIRYTLSIVVVVLFLNTTLFAQERIAVNPAGAPESTYNPQQLIERVLVNSDCAKISNITFKSGNAHGFTSYGYFRKGLSNFPIQSGIILSTGSVTSAIGPNDLQGSADGENTSWTGDADIKKILDNALPGTLATHNATVFEFDFIPLSDRVSFDYLFASEEYDQNFVCPTSYYQDGFAFIISGPGIQNDPGINGKNIALIKNTNTAVSAGTVNGGDTNTNECGAVNQQLYYSYNNNTVAGISGATTATNAPADFMGRTTVFTAQSKVVPNQKYHIKLVVADRGDASFSSAVFLAAGSFNVGTHLGDDRLLSNNNPVCQGEQLVLNAGTFQNATYKWTETSNPNTVIGTSSTYTVTQPGTYRVEVNLGSNCVSSDEIVVEYSQLPTVQSPVTLQKCDNDNNGSEIFNLTTANSLITLQTPITIRYYTTRALAEAGNTANQIVNPTTFQTTGTTVYARVENRFGCFRVSEVHLNIGTKTNIDLGPDRTLAGNNPLCQGSPLTVNAGTFQNATYKWTEVSAPNTVLGTNSTYTISQAGTYRVEVTTANTCVSSDEIVVEYSALPTVQPNVSLRKCDDNNDGISTFNLNDANSLITTQSATTITYYTTRTLAEMGNPANQIINKNSYNTSSTSIYARVANNFGCFSISEVQLQVFTSAIPAGFMLNYDTCDTAAGGSETDGIATFDFSNAIGQITALFPTNQSLDITFYRSTSDANAMLNPIDPANYTNTNSPNTQQIVVRVANRNNSQCVSIGTHINLTVHKIPQFQLQSTAILCTNTLPTPLTISAQNPSGNYTYQWTDSNNTPLNNGNTASYSFTTAGTYHLTATTTSGRSCSKMMTVVITASSAPTIRAITTEKGTSGGYTVQVEVDGEGTYEYALNNSNGPYQDSNTFTQVPAGVHTVYVRDKNGCGVAQKDVVVIAFPAFFTPNHDGSNDTWHAKPIGAFLSSKISIFDRYGKLLVQLDPVRDEWDGRYQGKLMPSNDYWFVVTLKNGEVFRGHFSLLRK